MCLQGKNTIEGELQFTNFRTLLRDGPVWIHDLCLDLSLKKMRKRKSMTTLYNMDHDPLPSPEFKACFLPGQGEKSQLLTLRKLPETLAKFSGKYLIG